MSDELEETLLTADTTHTVVKPVLSRRGRRGDQESKEERHTSYNNIYYKLF